MEWYARAVGALSLLPLTARTSWRYLGAIHGIQAGQAGPPTPEHSRMWNQCQHGGWYFLPWHRGYVAAFEAVLAKTIVDLGGPVDWALPYWNYLDATNPASRDIPQAFTDPTLPDGTPNPLAQAPRHGVSRLGPTPWLPTDITLAAINEPDYTSAAGTTGFGGGTTAFLHFGNLTGTVEANPHNLVHVMVGGVGPNAGYMSDPDLAALDPIFWVHHCNIDRLWAAWLTVPTNRMENGATWRSGPSPRQFAMPDKDGSNLVVFTPAQTIPGGSLAPVYDDLTKGTGVPTVVASVSTRTAMPAGVQPAPAPATLFGSNTEVVEVGASPATTTVHLATRRAQAVAAAGVVRERVFLNLENVRGAAPSGVLSVSVTAPSRGTVPSSAPAVEDTIALFGLAKASASDAGHGGNGLSFAIDITGLANTVAADDLDRLEVQIRQPGEAGDSPITVDRVSVFRQPVR